MASINRSNNKLHIGNGSKNKTTFAGEVNDMSDFASPYGTKTYYTTVDTLARPAGAGPWGTVPSDFSVYKDVTYAVLENKVLRYNADGSISTQLIINTRELYTLGFFEHSSGLDYFFVVDKLSIGSIILYGQLSLLTFDDGATYTELKTLRVKPLERVDDIEELGYESSNNDSTVWGNQGVFGHYSAYQGIDGADAIEYYNPFGTHDSNNGYGQPFMSSNSEPDEHYNPLILNKYTSFEIGVGTSNIARATIRNPNMSTLYYQDVFHSHFLDGYTNSSFYDTLLGQDPVLNCNQIIQVPGEDALLFQFANDSGASYGWNESTIFKAEIEQVGAFFRDLEFGENTTAYFAPIEYLGTPYGNADPDQQGFALLDDRYLGSAESIKPYSPIQCSGRQMYHKDNDNAYRLHTGHRFNLTAPGGRDIGSLSILGKMFDPGYEINNSDALEGADLYNSDIFKPQSYKLKFFNSETGAPSYNSDQGAFFGLSCFNNLSGQKANLFNTSIRKHTAFKYLFQNDEHTHTSNNDLHYFDVVLDNDLPGSASLAWNKDSIREIVGRGGGDNPGNLLVSQNSILTLSSDTYNSVNGGDYYEEIVRNPYWGRNKRVRRSQNMINFIDYLDLLFVDDIKEGVAYPKKAISIVSTGNGHKIMVGFSPAGESNIYKYSQIGLNAGQKRLADSDYVSINTHLTDSSVIDLSVDGIKITSSDVISVDAGDGLAEIPHGGMCAAQKNVNELDCYIYKNIGDISRFSMSNNPYLGKTLSENMSCDLSLASGLEFPIDQDSSHTPILDYNTVANEEHESNPDYIFTDFWLETLADRGLENYTDYEDNYDLDSNPYGLAISDAMDTIFLDIEYAGFADANYPTTTLSDGTVIQQGTRYDSLTTLKEKWTINSAFRDKAITATPRIVFNKTDSFSAASPTGVFADFSFRANAYDADIAAPILYLGENFLESFDEYFKVNKRFLSYDGDQARIYQGSLNSTGTTFNPVAIPGDLYLVDEDFNSEASLVNELIKITAGSGTTAPDTQSINFIAPFEVKYKLSYLYDNFQEGPLSFWSEKVDEPTDNKSTYTVDIDFDAATFNKRITHINLYRQYVKSDGTGDNYYQLVDSKPISPLTSFSLTAVERYQYSVIDDRSPNASYASLVGIPETLPDTYLNYGIGTVGDSYLFVTDADVPYSTGDFSHYIFRSMPNGRFSQFNWPTDNVRVPDKIKAMQSHNGRLYAFSPARMFLINQSTLQVEDTYEGTGCSNSNAIISTEYGLCFADSKNISLLTNQGPQIISSQISTMSNNKSPDGTRGWQDLHKTNIHVSFDTVRKSFLIFFSYSMPTFSFNNGLPSFTEETRQQHRCWAYNVIRKRWDLWSTAGPVTGTYISMNGSVVYTANSSFYKFCASTSTKRWSWHSKEFVLTGATQDKKFRNLKVSSDILLDNQNVAISLNKAKASELSYKSTTEGEVHQSVAKLKSGGQSSKFKTLKIELNKVRDAEVDSIGLVYTAKKAK